ncbi:carboxymuconolactone decarboxylase family protein [Azospirillum sp.]|uniref:carboxymuconolactone decarboxylase family protein n=1 Tax=Azospirillum sp. TaxID=34012 RepID=UPI002D5FD2AF|nr:carboxymuconolactone decarboxylase family protein [Azospirillum sp.]HYD65404.1 carboxymuconolactone decarboxylase family protein [Azospirillum sp.]
MQTRFHPKTEAPALIDTLLTLRGQLTAGTVPAGLMHLIDLRASQINGCHYCIRLHTGEARRDGETADRLEQLATWTTSDTFTPDERAALAWTEALTRGAPSSAIDRLHGQLRAHFDDLQVAEITMCVAAINAWNRIGIASYREAEPAIAG